MDGSGGGFGVALVVSAPSAQLVFFRDRAPLYAAPLPVAHGAPFVPAFGCHNKGVKWELRGGVHFAAVPPASVEGWVASLPMDAALAAAAQATAALPRGK